MSNEINVFFIFISQNNFLEKKYANHVG